MSIFEGPWPKKRIVVGCLLGLAMGLMSFLLLGFVTVILLEPLLLCLLYAFSGPIPVMVSAIFSCASFMSVGGFPLASIGFLALILPALTIMECAKRKMPFPTILGYSFGAGICGIIASLVVGSAATGGNLYGTLSNYYKIVMQAMPASVQDQLLSILYSSIQTDGTSAVLDTATRTQYIDSLCSALTTELSIQGLPILLQSSLNACGPAAYLCVRALHKKGIAEEPVFTPLSRLHLSAQTVVGILVATLTSYILYATKSVSGAETVFLSLWQIMVAVFGIQGAACLDRLLLRTNRKLVLRALLIVAMWVLEPTIVACAGLASAILGRYGILRRLKKPE